MNMGLGFGYKGAVFVRAFRYIIVLSNVDSRISIKARYKYQFIHHLQVWREIHNSILSDRVPVKQPDTKKGREMDLDRQ